MNRKSSRKTIAVVGGGSAGFTAARTAANLGARVLFFMGANADHASLCVNFGCMPSKAMFAPIDAMHHARRHGWLEVRPARPEAFLAQVVAWKDREIARFRAYRQGAIRAKESEDFQVIRADARFVDAHTLEAGGQRYRADAVIIATGSTTVYPPFEGLDAVRDEIWTNEEILANTILPESLTVIGGGAIGLEFAQRYARLGCRTTLLARSNLLADFPGRFGDRLTRIFEQEGIRVLRDIKVTGIKKDPDGWWLVHCEGKDGNEPIVGQRVLLATGRKPALGGLALEKAGISLGEGGRIEVGEDLRVAGSAHLFMAGDALGRRLVVHQAHIEAGIAADNAVNEGKRQWSRRANIQVVFTDPEFAFAGIGAREAEKNGHRVVTASKESRLVGKLHLGGDDEGFGEFVGDAQDHRLLGAGLLCQDAGELIHLPAYLIENRHDLYQAASAEYYHPTRIEIVSGIFDKLCREMGGTPFCRAPE